MPRNHNVHIPSKRWPLLLAPLLALLLAPKLQAPIINADGATVYLNVSLNLTKVLNTDRVIKITNAEVTKNICYTLK